MYAILTYIYLLFFTYSQYALCYYFDHLPVRFSSILIVYSIFNYHCILSIIELYHTQINLMLQNLLLITKYMLDTILIINTNTNILILPNLL
jgi:hypothetical protein